MSDARRFETILDEVARSEQPAVRLVEAPAGELRSVAAFPGAFNPPTGAHRALARAVATRGFDAVLFSVGTVTLDKSPGGIPLADRLALLVELAAGLPHAGVAAHNRGLYAEMAGALHAALPGLCDLAFVIGMDKAPQIFDARYYDDLEATLASLFSTARFLVAPRDERSRRDLDLLLGRPEARRWAGRFEWLELPERWRTHSATRVRSRDPEVLAGLPAPVADYLRRRRPFGD